MIYDMLFDWQQELVDKNKHRSTIGWGLDMGLGKTIIALAMAEVKECSNLLIITLATKKTEQVDIEGSFLYWLEKYNPELNVKYVLTNLESLYRKDKEAISLRKKQGILLKPEILEFIERSKTEKSAIIIDESHKIKTFSSLNNRSVKLIKTKMKNYKLELIELLSGTPFKRGYEEILTQIQYLGSKMTKTLFEEKYCIKDNKPGLTGWQQNIIGYRDQDEIMSIIHKFFITMRSEEVVNLPEFRFIDVVVPVSEEFKLFDREFIGGKPNRSYRNMAGYEARTAGEAYLRSRQLTSGFLGSAESYVQLETSKLKALRELLVKQPDNYLLFYNYTPEMYEIFKLAKELGYDIDIYCGEFKSERFYTEYDPDDLFDTRKRILITNYASGAAAKNWQKYNKTILYSTPNHGDYAQAIRRNRRIGSKNSITYYRFKMNCWIDKKRWEAIDKGIEYTSAMYDFDSRSFRDQIGI